MQITVDLCKRRNSENSDLKFLGQIVGFFDFHCLQESVDIFDFLHGSTYRGNLESETTTFGRLCPEIPCPVQTGQHMLQV